MNSDEALVNDFGSACLNVGKFQEWWSTEECVERQRRLKFAREQLIKRLEYLRKCEEIVKEIQTRMEGFKDVV